MKISLNWLRDLIDIQLEPKALAEKLASLGLPVEHIEETGVSIKNIVTAKILEVEKHPNADRLRIAQVTDGTTTRTIVCGAPNIAPGQIVPMAKPGTKFPNGLEIVVSKIRGIESQGMLCSARELGLSEDHAGIYLFPEETKLGAEISTLFNSDVIFDIDVTPNRSDALSHIGVARDISALTSQKLKTILPSDTSKVQTGQFVEIQEPLLCHRYMGRIIKGVKVGPSPKWLADRLMACGIRSINNIVDITNYVLLEWGHPLHAFDLKKVSGEKIIVRRAKQNELIKALDEKEYKLTQESLVIADNQKALAIAGIMGGEESGVTISTVDILLESAVFDRVSIRQNSKRLGLRSESSIRFEKGTDAYTAEKAFKRATDLILSHAGGSLTEQADVFPTKPKEIKIILREDRVAKVIGEPIPITKIKDIFDGLEISMTQQGKDYICTVPSHRHDLLEEIDLIEEIARVYGYDSVQIKTPKITIGSKIPSFLEPHQHKPLSELLRGAGITQAITSSFTSIDLAEKFAYASTQVLPLANPLSAEESILRPMLLLNLLSAVQRNISHQIKDVRLFEIGTVFSKGNGENKISESKHLGVVLYSENDKETWNESKKIDFYTLKGLIEAFNLELLTDISFDSKKISSFLHPYQSIELSARGSVIGSAGVLHPNFLDLFNLKGVCLVLEMDLDKLNYSTHKLAGFSNFPVVDRDIAVLVKKDLKWNDIENVVSSSSQGILKKVFPFDIYQGPNLSPDQKSIAFRVQLQHAEKTLSDAEINTVIDTIKTNLKERCGAQLR